MKKKGKGWHKESRRHSLSSKGIKSTQKYKVSKGKGKTKLSIGLPEYSKDMIKHITELADGKEWIAELNVVKGDIIIDDIQISEEIDHSYLRWNNGDEVHNVGYIHYHPETLIPEFSAQDFVLAFNIHDLRANKDEYPYTVMGLVYPDGDKLKVKMYGVDPSKERVKEFEGLELVERDLKDKLECMEQKKELIRMENITGEIK